MSLGTVRGMSMEFDGLDDLVGDLEDMSNSPEQFLNCPTCGKTTLVAAGLAKGALRKLVCSSCGQRVDLES